jgi:hypothetical protein
LTQRILEPEVADPDVSPRVQRVAVPGTTESAPSEQRPRHGLAPRIELDEAIPGAGELVRRLGLVVGVDPHEAELVDREIPRAVHEIAAVLLAVEASRDLQEQHPIRRAVGERRLIDGLEL